VKIFYYILTDLKRENDQQSEKVIFASLDEQALIDQIPRQMCWTDLNTNISHKLTAFRVDLKKRNHSQVMTTRLFQWLRWGFHKWGKFWIYGHPEIPILQDWFALRNKIYMLDLTLNRVCFTYDGIDKFHYQFDYDGKPY
jgi:hypothetical protein